MYTTPIFKNKKIAYRLKKKRVRNPILCVFIIAVEVPTEQVPIPLNFFGQLLPRIIGIEMNMIIILCSDSDRIVYLFVVFIAF